MEQLGNQEIELEKIKKELLTTYIRYSSIISYTDEELSKAAIQIKKFLDKLRYVVEFEG